MSSAAIRTAYLRGDTTEEMAEAGGVTAEEVEVYLTWWCSEGCPDLDGTATRGKPGGTDG